MFKFWINFGLFLMMATCGRSELFSNALRKVSNEIIANYFTTYKCITFISDVTHSVVDSIDCWNQTKYRINVLHFNEYSCSQLNGMFDELGNYKYKDVKKQTNNCNRETMLVKLIEESFESGCGGFVLQVTRKTNFILSILEAFSRAIRYRDLDKKYLLLPVNETDDDIDILKSPKMFFMPNIIIAVYQNKSNIPSNCSNDDEFNFRIFTHTEFNGYLHDELNLQYQVLDDWSATTGFCTQQDLFADKLRNVYGKSGVIAGLQYIPYSIIKNDSGILSYDGLEIRLCVEFMNYVNGTWGFMDNPDHLWGTLFENGSGNGVLGAVREHKADFGIGAIYQWYCEDLDCTIPYVDAGVTCLAPRPKFIPGWRTIVIPFAAETWMCVVIVFVLTALFLVVLLHCNSPVSERNITLILNRCREHIGVAFFTVFSLQVQQTPKRAHKNSTLGYFLKLIIIYFFLISICWSGGLSAVLTIPRYEPPINTVSDMLNKQPPILWGADHIAWTYAIRNSFDAQLQTIVRKFTVLDTEELRQHMYAQDFAYFLERLPGGHFGFSPYVNREHIPLLRIMEGNIYVGNCVIVLPKGSPYLLRFNELLLWMFDTGLIQHWELMVSLESVDNLMQVMIKTSSDKPEHVPTNLELHHIQGALFILAFGLISSILAFLAEITVFRIS